MTKRLFILGAGFSAAQGLPLVANLPERIESFLTIVNDPLIRCRRTDWGTWCDQFKTLGFENGLRKMKADLPPDDVALECICRGIVGLFDNRGALHACYRNFAKWVDGGKVITFNWDLLLEKSLTSTQRGWCYYDQTGRTTIIKPHGSLNWSFHARNKLEPEVNLWRKIQPNSGIMYNPLAPLSDPFSQGITVRNMRCLLFPGDKELSGDSDQVLLWREAEKVMDWADEVVFIGYSLPAYDRLASKTFKEHIGDKPVEVVLPCGAENFRRAFPRLVETKERFENSRYSFAPGAD